MVEIVLVAFISLFVTYCSTPIINKTGKILKITDRKDNRKIKKKSLVRLGGIGIVIAIYSSIFIVKAFYQPNIIQDNILFWPIIIGGLASFLIGLADDIYNISPAIRLFLQTLVASFCWNYGLKVEKFDLSWIDIDSNSIIFNDSISLLITILWIVGIINAINWMDGIDGLACGLTFISSIFIIIFGLAFNNYNVVFIVSSLLGTSIGFLRYNFYPAKILMGDGGAYIYGFLLAALSLALQNPESDYLKLNIGFTILAVPILDMVFVIFKRIINNKSPFYPDSNHIHHRIMNSGMNVKYTVIYIYSIAIWLGFISLFIEGLINYELIILSTIILLSLYISMRYKSKRLIK